MYFLLFRYLCNIQDVAVRYLTVCMGIGLNIQTVFWLPATIFWKICPMCNPNTADGRRSDTCSALGFPESLRSQISCCSHVPAVQSHTADSTAPPVRTASCPFTKFVVFSLKTSNLAQKYLNHYPSEISCLGTATWNERFYCI